MLCEDTKDGGCGLGSLAEGPQRALLTSDGSAGGSMWTDPQKQVRETWRTPEKDPGINLALCIFFPPESWGTRYRGEDCARLRPPTGEARHVDPASLNEGSKSTS